MNFNIKEDAKIEQIAITLGHETFIHLDRYMEEYIYQSEVGGTKEMRELMIAHQKDNARGKRDHKEYISGDPKFNKFRRYVNQLKRILGSNSMLQFFTNKFSLHLYLRHKF